MKKIIIYITFIFVFFNLEINAKESFFEEAKKNFDNNKIDESKFLLQRNIIYNPKDAKSYLYLAKIYNLEENEKEEEKNLNTTLLLESDNEEALYMLINIHLKRSNYSKVKDLTKDFSIICSKLCKNIKIINKNLKNIEPKNES
jgi:hypothetical protein